MIHLISQFAVQYTGCSAMCFIKSLHYCHTVQWSCLTCWIYTLLIIHCCRKGFRRMSPPCVLYNHCMLHVNSLFTKGPYDFQLTTSQFRHVTPGVVLYNGTTWNVPVIDLIKKNLPNLITWWPFCLSWDVLWESQCNALNCQCHKVSWNPTTVGFSMGLAPNPVLVYCIRLDGKWQRAWRY